MTKTAEFKIGDILNEPLHGISGEVVKIRKSDVDVLNFKGITTVTLRELEVARIKFIQETLVELRRLDAKIGELRQELGGLECERALTAAYLRSLGPYEGNQFLPVQ